MWLLLVLTRNQVLRLREVRQLTHTRRTRTFERGVPKQSHLQSLFFLKSLQKSSNFRCKSERLITRLIIHNFAYLHFAFSSSFLSCINKVGIMIYLLELCCLRTSNGLSLGVWWVSKILTHISHFPSWIVVKSSSFMCFDEFCECTGDSSTYMEIEMKKYTKRNILEQRKTRREIQRHHRSIAAY